MSLGPPSLAKCLEPSLFPTRLNTGPTSLTGCRITLFTYRTATWLILPVVICLSQRLSHACLSTSLTDSYLFGATPYRLVFVSRDDLILIYWTRRLLALHLTDSYSYLEMISALQTSIRISNTVIFVWRIIGPAGHQTYRALVIGPAGQQTYRAIAILSYLFGATPYGLVWRYRLRTCIRILR